MKTPFTKFLLPDFVQITCIPCPACLPHLILITDLSQALPVFFPGSIWCLASPILFDPYFPKYLHHILVPVIYSLYFILLFKHILC
jgi:hypothetical protein